MNPPDADTLASGQLVFARPDNVVWRLAPDRVLVRRVGKNADDPAGAELIGLVAAIWIALDEPASLPTLRARLAEADITPTEAECADALDELVAQRWLEAPQGQPRPDHER